MAAELIDPRDLARCRDAIRHGSLSFYTASRLLPARVRDPALALYAFLPAVRRRGPDLAPTRPRRSFTCATGSA